MKDFRELAEKLVTEMEEVLSHCIITNNTHIVMTEGVGYTFTVINNEILEPVGCSPHKAKKFTRKQAEIVATLVSNGNGVKGTAVGYYDAVEMELTKVKNLLVEYNKEFK